MDLSCEGVNDTTDPALELELTRLSSTDVFEFHPLRSIAQNSAIALSSGLRSSS